MPANAIMQPGNGSEAAGSLATAALPDDMETVLLTLGAALLWEPNDFVTSSFVQEEDFDLLPGEIARTVTGTYAIVTGSFLPDTWSKLSGAPMVDVTFYGKDVRDVHVPPAPYNSIADAKAGCERHHATGVWR